MPIGPLLIWVMGLEDAKAGRKPTDTEHAELCRLLNEALDAGACGWSAQRMLPTGPAAVQRDFDGTPMMYSWPSQASARTAPSIPTPACSPTKSASFATN